MNAIDRFASWCPDVAPVDDAALEHIWSELLGEPSRDEAARSSIDVEPTRIDVSGPPREPARSTWIVAVAAVAAALVGLGVVVAAQSDSRSRTIVPAVPVPTSSPTDTVSTDVDQPYAGSVWSWESLPAMPIAPRFQHAAVSTGDGVFIWGGCCVNDVDEPFVDGAYFDGSEWRVLPQAPLDRRRGDAVAAWTGREVVVLNGIDGVTGAAFDPESFTWREIAAPAADGAYNGGGRLLAAGDGRLTLVTSEEVHLYAVAEDRWSPAVRWSDGSSEAVSELTWGFASTGRVVGVLTAAETEDCPTPAALRLFDPEDGATQSLAIDDPDFSPIDLAALPDGRFLAVGRECGSAGGEPIPVALAIDPDTGGQERLAEPMTSEFAFRYGGLAVGDDVVFLDGEQGRLVAYRSSTDSWIDSDLIGGAGERISETPLASLGDDQVVVVSPGYGWEESGGGLWCCRPRNEVWVSTLPAGPDPADRSDDAPTNAAPSDDRVPEPVGSTLLLLDPPPPGYELARAAGLTEPGDVAIARYLTADSTTELHVVIRAFDLPSETLESLDRVTWDVDGRTVWSDGEFEGCLPDVCSIGLQWDENTYVSLMWVEPEAGDLAPGSTQRSLLELLPALVADSSRWNVGAAADVAQSPGPETDRDSATSGAVLVANANGVPGSAGRLSTLLADAGLAVGEAVNSAGDDLDETVFYVAERATCLAGRIVELLGPIGTEGLSFVSMPDTLPTDDAAPVSRPDVLIELGNDLADQVAADAFALDPAVATATPGRLVVVDGARSPTRLDAVLGDLAAAGIEVDRVLDAARPVIETTLHPLSDTTLWTCEVSDAAGIGGFDDWNTDVVDGGLSDDVDLVLVVGG